MHSISLAISSVNPWHRDPQPQDSAPAPDPRSASASSVSQAGTVPDAGGRDAGAASATVPERLIYLGARALRQLPVAVAAGAAGWAVQAGGLKIALARGAQGKDALPWIQFAGHAIEAFIKEGGGETVELVVGPRLAPPPGAGASKWFPHSLQSGLARFGGSMSEAGSTIGDAMVRAYAYKRMQARFGDEIGGSGDASDVTMRILADLGNNELLAIKGVSSGAWLAHKAWEGVAVIAMPDARRDNPSLSGIWKDLAVREAIGVAVRTAVGAANSAWLSHLAHSGETGYLLGAYSASLPAGLQAVQPFAIDVLFYLYLVHVKPLLGTPARDPEHAPGSQPLQRLPAAAAQRGENEGIGTDHDTVPRLMPSQEAPQAQAEEGPRNAGVDGAGAAAARPHEEPAASSGYQPALERARLRDSARENGDEVPAVPVATAAAYGKEDTAASDAGSSIAESVAARPGSAGKPGSISSKGKEKEV